MGHLGLVDRVGYADLQAAIADLESTKADIAATFGIGQTWQDVTASRVLGTTYTNNTGKPIQLQVKAMNNASNGFGTFTITINGVTQIPAASSYGNGYYFATPTITIPAGATYAVTLSSLGYSGLLWFELR